jgi:predicted ATPase
VLNEPETSLHPDLLPALARLIAQTSERSQIVVVSHAPALIDVLQSLPECHSITLEKQFGQTMWAAAKGRESPWQWPAR